MKVLVAGGAGYIGSVMVSRLLREGHAPVIIDDLSTGHGKSIPDNVPLYKGSVGDALLLDTVFKDHNIDLVMHFAAKISVDESVRHPALYYGNNLANTLSLLDAMVKHGAKNIIFSSTAAVYGEPEYLPVDEKHPLNPMSPYGSSKRMVEAVMQDYHKAYGLSCVVLRYFNAAGASLDGTRGECQKVKQNLIPILLDNLQNNRISAVYGKDWGTPDGTCIRDYVHVEDIVSAHIFAGAFIQGGACFEIVNLGSENGASVKEVIETLSSVSGREVKFQYRERRPGDVARVVATSEKAKRLLGWKPQHSSLETIVQSAYLWHFNRRY